LSGHFSGNGKTTKKAIVLQDNGLWCSERERNRIKDSSVMNCTHSMDLQKASQLHPYHALCSWIKGLRIHYRFKTLLWTLADKYGEDGLVFPSVKTLAREINVSRSTVHRWLNELEAAGLVTRKHRYRTSDGGQTSSYYVLNCDTPVAAVTDQEHKNKTYVLHAREAVDVIYMEFEEDENPETLQTVGVLAKEGLEPFTSESNRERVEVKEELDPPTREKGLLTGFDPRQGVRGDEGVEPQTREVSHPSHQISNLALPTTQPSNPETDFSNTVSPKSIASSKSAIEPIFTDPAPKSTLVPKSRALRIQLLPRITQNHVPRITW
jgi:DNA-binding transcriptional ArsR family regulator